MEFEALEDLKRTEAIREESVEESFTTSLSKSLVSLDVKPTEKERGEEVSVAFSASPSSIQALAQERLHRIKTNVNVNPPI